MIHCYAASQVHTIYHNCHYDHAPAGRFPGGGGGCSDKGGRGGNAYKGGYPASGTNCGWQNAGGDSSAQNAGAGGIGSRSCGADSNFGAGGGGGGPGNEGLSGEVFVAEA